MAPLHMNDTVRHEFRGVDEPTYQTEKKHDSSILGGPREAGVEHVFERQLEL